ncbi:MAG: hypothetical protein HKM95_00955 [Inquilinus sp.]|nr:hypothetical protein [Inquilinus sp.]
MKSITSEAIHPSAVRSYTESDLDALERANSRRLFLFAGGAAVVALAGGTVVAKGLIALGERYGFGFGSNGRRDRPNGRRGSIRVN